MDIKSQTKYHHGNLKDTLVQTALEMVESDGVNSITLRDLTKKIGTSRSALYRHFDSKNALIKAVVQAGFDKLTENILPTLLADSTTTDKLYNMGKAYINFALKNPNIYRAIFGHELMKEREEQCDIEDEQEAASFHVLVNLVVQAQEQKVLKEADPILQATVIWSMMHGMSSLLIDGHIHVQDNIDVLYDLSFTTLIDGLKY